jgi:uncharacterized membrane protein (DUF485 family)
MAEVDPERRRRVRRTAIVLALIALAFYLGFILMGVYRS